MVKYLFFIIYAITANLFLAEDCHVKLKEIKDYYYSANYIMAKSNIKIFYDYCKNDCKYFDFYLFLYSLGKDKEFNEINEKDVEENRKCYLEEKIKPEGLKYYYYRKNMIDKMEKELEIEKMKIKKPDFYYYDYSFKFINEGKIDDINDSILEAKFFCDSLGAYIFYLKGNLDKAQEIAKCVIHRLTFPKMENSILNSGVLQLILKRIILNIILGLGFDSNEKEIIEKAKEHFPFYFKIYKLN